MIEIWIPLTIIAAFLQNLRSAFQKHLKSSLSTAGASYVRFLYACPFAIIYCYSINYFLKIPLPEPNKVFLIFCFLGGISQILFTILLIYLFSFRSFDKKVAFITSSSIGIFNSMTTYRIIHTWR